MKDESRKKANTAIFIAVATVLNVILMIVFMIIGFVVLTKVVAQDNQKGGQLGMVIVLIGSVALAWFIYSRAVKWYMKRVNVDEKFAPLFSSRKRKPLNDDEHGTSIKG